VTQTAAKPQPETAPQPVAGELLLPEIPPEDTRELHVERFRLLWSRRRSLFRASAVGLLASTLVAFLIPKSYTSTTQLMPPDSQSTSSLAMMAGMAAKAVNLVTVRLSSGISATILDFRLPQKHLLLKSISS